MTTTPIARRAGDLKIPELSSIVTRRIADTGMRGILADLLVIRAVPKLVWNVFSEIVSGTALQGTANPQTDYETDTR